jgi:NAD(P)-dependent dehydrogenase (short-subunit alcohol dehydrogenase family)
VYWWSRAAVRHLSSVESHVALFVRRVEIPVVGEGSESGDQRTPPGSRAKAVRPMQTGSAEIHGIASDVATAEGGAATLEQALAALGGLDVLVNNAGAVRVGRRENTDETELQAMIDVTAPILLTRAAPPVLRNSGDAMIVNVSSGIAPVGAPFYETCATVKAGLAYFGEALRRELKREGIHVLTVSIPAGRTLR